MNFLNQKGNLLVTISFLLIICASVGAFLMNTKRVSEAIQSLDKLQLQAVIKGDIQKNIAQILKSEEGSLCLTSVADEVRNSVGKFEEGLGTTFTKQFDFPAAISAFDNNYVKCFINRNKFGPPGENLKITRFKIEMKRTNALNLSNPFIDVGTIITIGLASEGNGVTNILFNLKHRMAPKSLEQYGVVITDYNNSSGSIFQSTNLQNISIFARVLVSSSASSVKFSHFASTTNAIPKYFRKVEIEGNGFSLSTTSSDLINDGTLAISKVFKQGVEFEDLSSMIKKPWVESASAYEEEYWYHYMKDAYILPKMNPGISAIKRAGAHWYYGEDASRNVLTVVTTNTRDIFEDIPGYGDKKYVSTTCSYTNITSGIYKTLIFNDLTKEFTIDLSGNEESAFPPIFCGAVAAKKIIIKLNSTTDPAFVKHFLIGKFITKEGFKLSGDEEGKELVIMDIQSPERSQFESVYSLDPGNPSQTFDELSKTLYIQKHYQAQNFYLPLFKDIPPASVTGRDYYLPRPLRSFFTVDAAGCGTGGVPASEPGTKCRSSSINNPNLDVILNVKDYFYFEVESFD